MVPAPGVADSSFHPLTSYKGSSRSLRDTLSNQAQERSCMRRVVFAGNGRLQESDLGWADMLVDFRIGLR